MLDRRQMLLLTAAGAFSFIGDERQSKPDIPIVDGVPRVDYHVHVGDEISVDRAVAVSRQRGIKFGLLQHAGVKGRGFQVSNDTELEAWIRSLEGKDVFKGIEGEGTDWMSAFSKSALKRLDYVQTDPLGMPDDSGKPAKLWSADFRCADPQSFMDRYVDFHVQLISTLPIDILAVPTFLPEVLRGDYDRLWTLKRMQAVIDAAVKFNVALEIDSRFGVPSLQFLQTARAARAKFSFGSNYQTIEGIGDIQYGIQMYRKLGLSIDRFFRPSGAPEREKKK